MSKDVRIRALIANPSQTDLNCDVDFLVDTGASLTVIPRRIAKQLKLRKVGNAKIGLAAGRVVTCDLVYVYLFVDGEGLTIYAAVNPDGDALLGCDVMCLLQFQVDVARKRVFKAVRRFKVLSVFLQARGKRLRGVLSGGR